MSVCMSVYHHLSAGDRTEPRVLGLFGKFNPHPPWSLSYFQPTFSIYIWFTVESAPSDMRTDCKSMLWSADKASESNCQHSHSDNYINTGNASSQQPCLRWSYVHFHMTKTKGHRAWAVVCIFLHI